MLEKHAKFPRKPVRPELKPEFESLFTQLAVQFAKNKLCQKRLQPRKPAPISIHHYSTRSALVRSIMKLLMSSRPRAPTQPYPRCCVWSLPATLDIRDMCAAHDNRIRERDAFLSNTPPLPSPTRWSTKVFFSVALRRGWSLFSLLLVIIAFAPTANCSHTHLKGCRFAWAIKPAHPSP